MTLSKGTNSTIVTGTRNRIDDVMPQSGICAVCLDGCPGTCEVAKSSFRGREVLYPEPFGTTISAAMKEYPVDLSHFHIQGTAVGAVGIEADSDAAVFPNVDISVSLGSRDHRIACKLPIITGALGSTDVARNNWEGMAIGAAISGFPIVIGENVCAMDPESEIKDGRIVRSPEMERRVRLFQDWYEGYGAVLVQYNVEDWRLRVPEYVVEKLGVEAIEIKWGQGAKNIGGEVKLSTLESARQLKRRGYVVLPDPEDPIVAKAFGEGEFKEFERHSRLGMASEEGFHKEVEHLRKAGVKFVSLKTGAYRAADLARAIRWASDAELDLVVVDGSGGGTGMSPWRMMNEWGIPTVYLESLLYKFAKRLADRGAYVPDLAIAGGFSLEDHVFKGLALGSPFVKAICMGRATMIPAFVGKYIQGCADEGKKLPQNISKFGTDVEHIFITAEKLKERFNTRFKKLPYAAIGVYTFCDRVGAGLMQLMAGARKFALQHISRDDLIALTREAADVSGIPYVMEHDQEEVDRILG